MLPLDGEQGHCSHNSSQAPLKYRSLDEGRFTLNAPESVYIDDVDTNVEVHLPCAIGGLICQGSSRALSLNESYNDGVLCGNSYS